MRETINSLPYTPTKIQLRILDVILRTHSRGIFSLIEAANGVGKTTCLAAAAAMLANKGVKTTIFCLTYKQISRVINELERVDPTLRAVVVGSHNAFCSSDNTVSPRVICRIRQLRELCAYGKPTADYSQWLLGVDKAVEVSRSKGVCAYEAAWQSVFDAQIVVAPQAYLLYENSWNKISKIIEGNFVLVDECHNLIHSGVNVFSFPLAFESPTCRSAAQMLAKRKRWSKRRLVEKLGEKDDFVLSVQREIKAVLETKNHLLAWHYVNEHDLIKLLWEANYDRIFINQNQCQGFLGFPEEYLNKRFKVFCGGVFVSATPGSVETYRKIVYDRPLYVERLEAPYTRDQLRIYIVNDFTTRFVERSDESYGVVCKRILALLETTRSIGVYFPSYEYLGKVALTLIELYPQFSFKTDSNSLIELLHNGHRAVLSVQGGSEGEGSEIPGGLDLVLVVGLALPFPKSLQVFREKMYRGLGISNPDKPAYMSWAIQKAVQAVGRVIRGPNDKGVGILMDQRFEYAGIRSSLPEWFQKYIVGSMDFEKLMSSL